MSQLKVLVSEKITKLIDTMRSLDVVSLINMKRELDGNKVKLEHYTFMEKVPQVLGKQVDQNFLGYYKARNGKSNPCYYFPKREAMLMLMSYDYDLQAAVYDRMTELENLSRSRNVVSIPDFSNPAEAARAWAIEYEQKQAALIERDIAIATKAEIGSRREATAMNTASQAVKRANELSVLLDESKEWSTIKRMEIITGLKFNWRLLKSASQDIGITPVDVYDPNFGTVKAYHKDAWLEAYAMSIEQ